MSRRSTSDPTPIKSEVRTTEIDERIRRRAYDLYEQRGRLDGHDMDDWLQAEAEMSGKSKTAAA
ncbi:MAG TPA: DUF2934 domain-containing protein [Terriglobales bacterium]|nr:DUF2934 domain-containing protein [Terriglobales bacterium]